MFSLCCTILTLTYLKAWTEFFPAWNLPLNFLQWLNSSFKFLISSPQKIINMRLEDSTKFIVLFMLCKGTTIKRWANAAWIFKTLFKSECCPSFLFIWLLLDSFVLSQGFAFCNVFGSGSQFDKDVLFSVFSDCSAILESWGYSTNCHSSISTQSVKYWTESFATLRPSLPPFLKSLFPLPCLFSVPPLLSYFRQFPCPHVTPYYPNRTNKPSLVQTNIKRVILPVQLLLSIKNQFLMFFIPLQIGYLNLQDVFSFIFRQLRMTFFHKIIVAEKNFFFQMHNIFAKGKVISKCKNNKPWKN